MWLACGLALAFAGAPAAAAPGAGLAADVSAPVAADPPLQLPTAQPFVLVVADNSARLKRSEAYGDWQAYLTSFIERRRGDLPVHQVGPEKARMLLPNWPRGLRNGTLFVNAQGKGLLHRGLVLEPKVYEIGKAFAERGPTAPEAARYGLAPFRWKPAR